MYQRKAIALVVSLSLVVAVTACQQPSKVDQPAQSSAEVGREPATEPGWTIGWGQLKGGMDAVEVLWGQSTIDPNRTYVVQPLVVRKRR